MGDESTKELFRLVRELKADIAVQTAILGRVEEDMAAKEKRIKDLELESARHKGVVTVIAAIGGVVGSLAIWLVKHLTGGGG